MDDSGDRTKCTSQIDLIKLADRAGVEDRERKIKYDGPKLVLTAGWMMEEAGVGVIR